VAGFTAFITHLAFILAYILKVGEEFFAGLGSYFYWE
jgi:hypothetical protein